MFDKEMHDFCSEYYTVEKSLELVVNRQGEPTTVRIDALRDWQSGRYLTRAYLQEHVKLQPTYPQSNGKYQREPEDFIVWVAWLDFPWTDGDSVNAVLRSALGFLSERCDVSTRT